MGLFVQRVTDLDLEHEWMATLRDAGFDPEVEEGVIHLRGVGVAHGDRSVGLVIQTLAMDGHRVLQLQAPIRSMGASFATVTLAAAKGNTACNLAKFSFEEVTNPANPGQAFSLTASFHLYADHLSREEFIVMVSLFLKEVDEIDNELVEIMDLT